MFVKKAALLFASLLFCCPLFALTPEKRITQYVHDVWQTDQGLPQNTVQAIVRSREGYLWLATQEGFVRFDGIRFTHYDTSNTPILPTNNIQVLLEDKSGTLWIGTEGGGLLKRKNGILARQDGLRGETIRALFEDKQGNLWIGTYDGGLHKLKDKTISVYDTAAGLSSNRISSILQDSAGQLWVGTYGGGLNLIKDGRFTSYKTDHGLSNDTVFSLCEYGAGTLLVGTRRGLNVFKDGKFTLINRHGILSSEETITALYSDIDGNLWIGTGESGIVRFRSGEFESLKAGEGLSNNRIRSIYEDDEMSLWIGTEGGGLNRLKDGKFITITSREGLPNDMIYATFQKGEGDLWAGTRGGGLSRFNGKKWKTYSTADGLPANTVLSVWEDRNKTLWIGTEGAGLAAFKDDKFTRYTTKDGLSSDFIYSIFEDTSGRLWIGTGGGGINLKEQNEIRSFTTANGLSSDVIFTICEGRRGDVWFGSYRGWIMKFSNGKFVKVQAPPDRQDQTVFALYEDHDGNLWIGSYGSGLYLLKNGRYTNFRTVHGLFNDVIYQILDDGRGNLWMSCNKGIFRVSKKELIEFSEGRRKRVQSSVFTREDGLRNNECNGAIFPAGFKDAAGKLWFPTIQGLAMVDPAKIRLNKKVPSVIIEELIVDEISSNMQPNSEFPPGDGKLEFHFTGLSLYAPEKVQFRYKLEGFDRDWIEAGTRRVAYYTNIPPGKYNFRVAASNNDGLWNESGAVLPLKLAPHFYQTIWFYLFCVLAAIVAALSFYRIRMNQLKGRFMAVLEERNRIARELHDTLASGLSGILLQLGVAEDMIERKDEQAKNHVDQARKLAKSSLNEARRSVYALRSEALEKATLPEALLQIARQITDGTPVKVEINTEGSIQKLKPEVESNLLRIGQETLTNAVRHGEAKRIEIQILPENSTLELIIRDDGKGFNISESPQHASGHFGLHGIKERVAQMKGTMKVDSHPGKGTRISVKIPL